MSYSYPRDAVVAGGGLAGLFMSTALAQRGWSVRTHEQSEELRMFGAGIWLWENGLRALEAIGALEGAIHRGQRMSAWEIRDRRGRLLRRRRTYPFDRLIVPPRADVYEALIETARAAGVEMVTGSKAVRAHSDGVIEFADGHTERASLIVAADGVRSLTRESLDIKANVVDTGSGAVRLMIPRLASETQDICSENWSGTRGLLYNPCSDEHVYLCLSCPQSDVEGRQVPVNVDSWVRSYPRLESVLRRIDGQGRWDKYCTVDAKQWSAGRVAIVGDAAHGQPPSLGQAANLAFANCLALSEFVSGISNVEQALKSWEQVCRPVTEHTRRWTNAYSRVVKRWPPELEDVRSIAVKTFVNVPFVEQMLNRAQHNDLHGLLRRA